MMKEDFHRFEVQVYSVARFVQIVVICKLRGVLVPVNVHNFLPSLGSLVFWFQGGGEPGKTAVS